MHIKLRFWDIEWILLGHNFFARESLIEGELPNKVYESRMEGIADQREINVRWRTTDHKCDTATEYNREIYSRQTEPCPVDSSLITPIGRRVIVVLIDNINRECNSAL